MPTSEIKVEYVRIHVKNEIFTEESLEKALLCALSAKFWRILYHFLLEQ